MGIMPDSWIKKMAIERKMIDPFVENQVKKNVLSYGLSSYGYDARVSSSFKIFTNVNSATVDPKDFSESSFVDRDVDSVSYTHLRAHETEADLVCRLLLEKKKYSRTTFIRSLKKEY